MVPKSYHLKFWTNLLCWFIIFCSMKIVTAIFTYTYKVNNENEGSTFYNQYFALKEITLKSAAISNVGMSRKSATLKPLTSFPITLKGILWSSGTTIKVMFCSNLYMYFYNFAFVIIFPKTVFVFSVAWIY